MRYVPAPTDEETSAPSAFDGNHDKAMAEVWQWALDEDREPTPEELVAAENRASVVDDETCPMFEDLFKAIPGASTEPKMRLVRD